MALKNDECIIQYQSKSMTKKISDLLKKNCM